MEVYAAMVDRMDQGIGKVIEQLKRIGQFDSTLILFLQDNGACAELQGRSGSNEHPDIARPDKPPRPPLALDELITGIVPSQTRDGFPVRMGKNVYPGPADTYLAYARGWANVSNTPFREYKHWVHEGGISTPLIAHWPAGISAKGELRKQPGHLIDIMATCVDLSGSEYPAGATPLEGRSLAPAFADLSIDRDAIYWEHEGNRAIRRGDWKAVAKGPGGKWELYDLSTDRVESTDLAAREPATLRELVDKWEAYAQRTNVLPWIWTPAYGEKTALKNKKK
jgi:arylsulfatase